MSWCRWGTICENNRSSDLYIYEDVSGGVTIHLASRRCINEDKSPKINIFWSDITEEDVSQYILEKEKRNDWIKENGIWENINSFYDSTKSYNFNDKDELIYFLNELRKLGYNFPDHVFETAKEWEQDDYTDEETKKLFY